LQGAQCRLDGYVSNITKDNGQVKDVFYVFNMKLIDVQQGTQLWSNEKQIRKDMTK
jgi:PBP1b-binding outer membrane lipoprotein LpoB